VARDAGPLIDRLGGAAIVNGAGTKDGGIRLWVDLPELDELRQFVEFFERSESEAPALP
jgi:hypothetical protein